MTGTTADAQTHSTAELSVLDRLLPVWIGLAMAAGLLLGRLVPDINTALSKVVVDEISLPIAAGLLIMMYPVLAKVRYDRLHTVTGDRRLLISSLLLNWVLGPALMFTLAWAMLPDLPTSGYTDRLIASAKLLARRQIKMHSPGRGPRRLTSHRGPRPRERSSGTTPNLHTAARRSRYAGSHTSRAGPPRIIETSSSRDFAPRRW